MEWLLQLLSLFSLAEFYETTKTLVLFMIGISLYAVFVFKFYDIISKRNVFDLKYQDGRSKILTRLFYVFKYLIIFPFVIFAWFVVIAALLVFLAKNQSLDQILLASMALTGVIRITSYYKEALSQDLAKLLPLILLGTFLIDISYFSIDSSIEKALSVVDIWKSPIYYLLFVVAMEFILRVVTFIIGKLVHKKKTEDIF